MNDQPASDRTAILQCQGLGRRAGRDGDWLLQDVSLSLNGGDRLAIVGPTGAGKTLLVRTLALLDEIDAGQILWRGEPIADRDAPRYRSRVVYLHQRPALFDGDVEANLQRPFALAAHRERTYQREKIVALLESLGRDDSFLAKQPGDLSGGEGQIVALLRCIQLDPEVLLLDEPTAALDAASTAVVETLVENWLDESPDRRAFIWISHDAAQSERIANRTLAMAEGRLQGEA